MLRINRVPMETIFIKNMVCSRCKLAATLAFEKARIPLLHISLGQVQVRRADVSPAKLAVLDSLLKEYGLERTTDRKSRLLEQLKAFIIEYIHFRDLSEIKLKWSQLLEQQLGYDYDYLSKLFSSANGITLERYIIKQKIEKVKAYLAHDEMRLKEIAYRMGYKNTNHVSSQFRKVTGVTISCFRRNIRESRRLSVDQIT